MICKSAAYWQCDTSLVYSVLLTRNGALSTTLGEHIVYLRFYLSFPAVSSITEKKNRKEKKQFTPAAFSATIVLHSFWFLRSTWKILLTFVAFIFRPVVRRVILLKPAETLFTRYSPLDCR